MGICLLITFLLYRDIRTIAKLSVGMWLWCWNCFMDRHCRNAEFRQSEVVDFPSRRFSFFKELLLRFGGAPR